MPLKEIKELPCRVFPPGSSRVSGLLPAAPVGTPPGITLSFERRVEAVERFT
jgi:hypothetical protein